MASTLFVGMVVCAKANVLNTSTFTNVTLSTSTSSTLTPSSPITAPETTVTALFNSGTPITGGSTGTSAGELVDAVKTK
jgi:hypothetical protein